MDIDLDALCSLPDAFDPVPILIGSRGFPMEAPAIPKGKSLARLIQGTVLGAIATTIVGFNWGGWMLESTAARQAEADTTSAVVALLAPLCVSNFQNAADASSNLEEFKRQSSYKQASFMEKGGWANFAGADTSKKGIAKACVALLTNQELAANS